jgi:hypothetical protein
LFRQKAFVFLHAPSISLSARLHAMLTIITL